MSHVLCVLERIYWARPDKVYYACTKDDAAKINFDDDFIYQELDKDYKQRSIPFEQISQESALPIFREWSAKNDKTLY